MEIFLYIYIYIFFTSSTIVGSIYKNLLFIVAKII